MQIQNPRELAASFALLVTERTHPGAGMIAKNGDESLFQILKLLVPQVGTYVKKINQQIIATLARDLL